MQGFWFFKKQSLLKETGSNLQDREINAGYEIIPDTLLPKMEEAWL